MERAQVFQVMQDKAAELLDVDPGELQEDRSFVGDLGVDSLSLVEYVMDLEDALGIELPEDEVVATRTIGAFLDLLVSKLDEAPNRDG